MNPESSKYIAHEFPVWRDERNYIAMADLGPFGLHGSYEQLWFRMSGDRLILACIPFWVYGAALGDVVRLSQNDQMEAIEEFSGRRVLRVMFTENALPSAARFKEFLEDSDLLSEWDGDRYVAIDIPVENAGAAGNIGDRISYELDNGMAYWEWGDSRPFSIK